MRAVLLHPHDPCVPYASGVGTMINAFITCAPEDLQVELVGITSDPKDSRLRSWHSVEVEGRQLRWFPLLVDHPSIRARVPLSFRYTFLLEIKLIEKPIFVDLFP